MPQYPNAWCRLERVGQTFNIYRSDDGKNWVKLGTTTWPDSTDEAKALMPDKLYVGIDYSPENGNVLRHGRAGRMGGEVPRVWRHVPRHADDTDVGGRARDGNPHHHVHGHTCNPRRPSPARGPM